MKILHINSENSWRGGEQQLAYLILGSQNNFPENNIFVMGRSKSALEEWCLKNEVIFIPNSLRGSADIKAAYYLAKICKKYQIDLIHAHTSHAHAVALYSKLFFNKAKIILHRRVSFPIKNNFITKYKYTSKHIKKIICISKDVKRVLTKKTKQPEKATIIYDAIDPNRFKNQPSYHHDFHSRFKLPKSKYIISNIAALTTEKDYSTFINTAEICIKNNLDAIFLIVGEGQEREILENIIKQKKLTESVFMLGFIKNIKDILNHTDLLLLTSKQEGLGSSILDAFANHIPVVATAAGGIPELIQHEKTGMLAEIKDYRELAKHVNTVLTSPTLRTELTSNGHNLLEKKFLIPNMLEKTQRVYLDII